MSVETSLISSIFSCLLFFGMVVVFYAVRPREERRFLFPLATLAFAVKVLLVPIYFWILVTVGLNGFAYVDSSNYHFAALKMAGDLAHGRPWEGYGWSYVDPGYNFVGAVLYWVFGPNVLIPRFLNVAISSMTLLYVYRVAMMTFNERAARIAAVLLAFIPFTLLHTINHRKEAFVQFFAMLIFYHALLIFRQEKRWSRHVVLLGAGLLGMAFFRNGFILPFLAVLLVAFLVSQRSLIWGWGLAFVTLVAVIAFQFLVVGEGDGGLASASVERLEGKLARNVAYAEVGGLVRLVRMTSLYEIYKLPIGAVLMLILPFPPKFAGSLPSVLFSWGNLVGLALLPATLRGGWSILTRKDWRLHLPVLVFPAVFIVLLASIHLGVIRYRETISPMLLILAAGGLQIRSNYLVNAVIFGSLFALALLVYVTRMS